MKKLFWLFGIVSLLWIGIIFMFSAKKGNDSAGESMTFLRWCCENTIDDFSTWSYEKQQAFIRRWNYPVRKLAHVTEYFMLGVLLAGTWNLYRSRAGYGWMLPWIIGTVFAAFDEIHQWYVPGREAKITDVLIDSVGVLLGAYLITQCILVIRTSKASDRKIKKSFDNQS